MLASFLELNGLQTPGPGAVVNVSDPPPDNDVFDQSEMLIVVNPTNPLNLVGFSHVIASPIALEVYRTIDGGLNWRTTQIDNAVDGQGTAATGNRFDPAIAFDANGLLYIAYGYRGQTAFPARNTDLIVATSSDGGMTFANFQEIDSQPDIVTPSTTDNDLPGLDRWTLTTGRDDISGNQAAIIAYTRNVTETLPDMTTATDQQITLRGTRDGWVTWTAPMIVNDDSINGTSAGNLAAMPVFGPQGGLYVSWQDGATSILMDRDMDGLWGTGGNFGADITVRNNPGLVNIGPPGPPAQPERGLKLSPVLAANAPNNDLYIAVQELVGTTGADTDIMFGRSIDNGLTWNFSRVTTNTGTDFHPQIAVDEHSNAIGIAFYTTAGDQSTGNDDVHMRLAVSTDFGNSWTQSDVNALTSNEAGGYGGDYLEYTGLSFRDGTAQVLWASRSAAGANLDAFTVPISLNSSTNGNVLAIFSLGGASDNIVVQQSAQNASFIEVIFNGVREFAGLAASIDKVRIEARGGTDSISIVNLPPIPVELFGTSNVDTLNINALTGASSLTIYGGDGGDVFNLAPNNPFAISALNAPINIFGDAGADILNVGSGGLHAVSGLVNYNAGAYSEGNTLNLYDNANAFILNYTISATYVVRDQPFFFGGVIHSSVDHISLSATDSPNTVTVSTVNAKTISVNGNGGNDNFIVDVANGNFGGSHNTFFGFGGDGVDTLTLDNSQSTDNLGWRVAGEGTDSPGTVFHGSAYYFTAFHESVAIRAGNGSSPIRIEETMTQNVSIDAGGGNDDFILEAVSTYRDFQQVGQTPPFHYAMVIDGGNGFNSLTVDDRSTYDRNYYISPDYARADEGAPLGLEFDYDSVQSVTFYASTIPDISSSFTVFGTSSDIPSTHQMTLFGGPADNSFVIHPHDGAGNLTINGTLGIFGGAGIENLLVEDSGSSVPINYLFRNLFGAGTTNIDGMGARSFGAASDIENITIDAGGGADTFSISSFKSGSGLRINGGGGGDTVNFGNSVLATEVTNMASFHFNGQDGFDTLMVHNSADAPASIYAHDIYPGEINATTIDRGVLHWLLTDSNIELRQFNAGTDADRLHLDALETGVRTVFNGGGGLDLLALGFNVNTLENIRGPVVYDAGPGGGYLSLRDGLDTSADIVHLDQTTIGARPGDNLFGLGGSLTFTNVTNYDAFNPGVLFDLGSGADTVFIEPLPTARVTVNGGNPTTAPGDTFRLSLAGVTTPVFTPNGTGAGTYTFGNAAAVNYTGFESASTYIPGDYSGNGVVGPEDYNVWRGSYGMVVAPGTPGDGNGDGKVDTADYVLWRNNLGAVSPASGAILAADETNPIASLAGSTSVIGAQSNAAPGIANGEHISVRAPLVPRSSASGDRGPLASTASRPPLKYITTTPKNGDALLIQIVDRAHEERGSQRWTFFDDYHTALSVEPRDGNGRNEVFNRVDDFLMAFIDGDHATEIFQRPT